MGLNLSFVSARADLMIPAMTKILDGFAAGQLKSPPVKGGDELCFYSSANEHF